jgi:RNA polymerase sigma factor (sigma-70 family)
MATGTLKSMNRIVRRLTRAALLGEGKIHSDGRLLDAFLANGDEAAFEILVKRHGPMVLGVCRRVIGNLHDAEDAFQAVFLVLAKKAASLVPRELVGNWLYGVAYRTALQARTKLCRRRARELQVMDMPHPTVSTNFDLLDLHQALDRELSKLPDKYRVPIVLCDLENRSRRDVAGQLQIPEGTLSSRLTTGRKLLAKQLTKHGLAFSGGALATILGQQTASACMAPALLSIAVKAAGLTAVGKSAAPILSTQVLALSQGVLKTMFLSKIKVILVLVAGLFLGGVGAGFIGLPGKGAQAAQAAQPVQKPAQPEEPIDGGLLLNQQIQAELRLSKNQIDKLLAVSRGVDDKTLPNRKEVGQIQQQIEALQRKIAKLQERIGKIHETIENERKHTVGKAAPEILSARALKRVREIQRQKRGLRELLQDPKVQSMLKINDEQFKKIETILENQPKNAIFYDLDNYFRIYNTSKTKTGYIEIFNELVPSHLLGWSTKAKVVGDFNNDGRPDLFIAAAQLSKQRTDRLLYDSAIDNIGLARDTLVTYYDARQDLATLRKLFAVLTDAQKAALLRWVGEPYQSPSWQELRKQK